MNTEKARIYHDRSDKVVEVFPQYSELFSEKQLQHVWRASAIAVEKDKQSLLVEMSPAQSHSIITTLSLFTKYEVYAGEDWWNGRFREIVKGPEFTRLALVNAMVEIAVHKPFYQKINQVLGLDNDEFYSDYVKNPVLVDRIAFINSVIENDNDLVALGGFSFVEGAILYSAFALLKSYQANGQNHIKTIISGINYSLAEEGIHAVAAATVYRHLEKETLEDGVYEKFYGKQSEVQEQLYELAKVVYEHEAKIIDMIFEKGDLHISKAELLAFVAARLNSCLSNLGLNPIFDTTGDTISDWFYKNITSFVMHDFFNSGGSQYTATWNEEDFDVNNCEDEDA
jgi:ribonucleoside-diphosphate reductase beta chain